MRKESGSGAADSEKGAHMRILIAIFFLFLSAGQAVAGESVTLSQINNSGVMGSLGVRLGTIVTVEGVIVKNDSQQKADSGEPFFLSIEKVNGALLKRPVKYPFRTANQWVKLEEPKVGYKFKYIGYETGGFAGSPEGEFKYVPPYQATGYYFDTSFLVLSATK